MVLLSFHLTSEETHSVPHSQSEGRVKFKCVRHYLAISELLDLPFFMLVAFEITRFSSTFIYLYKLLILVEFIESFLRNQLMMLFVKHIQISWVNIIKWTSAWLFPSECILNSPENWFSIIWGWGDIITQKLYNTLKMTINQLSIILFWCLPQLCSKSNSRKKDVILLFKFHFAAVI